MKKTCALLLFSFALPAAARFSVRSEVPLSEPVYGVSRGIGRGDARIATNGDEYLAVWTDTRHGGEPSVYAARLRADGTLIDPLGLRIANGGYAGPVAWSGDRWLIAYELAPAERGYVRTMSTEGVFGEPIEVGPNVRVGAMATNGTNVLLALPSGAVLLDLGGRRLKDVALAIGEHQTSLRVAAAGASYLVAAALPSVVVQRVSSDGVAGTLRTLAPLQAYTQIGLASDGERFLVAWHGKRIYAQIVTDDGMPAGAVQKVALTGDARAPAVAWRDGEYFLAFHNGQEGFQRYAVRVAGDGSPIGAPKLIGQDFSDPVEIAAHGRGGIALIAGSRAGVFDDASVAGNDVFRRVVDVAVTARVQTNVRLAPLDDGYVAAWHEDGRIFLSTEAGTTPVAVTGSIVTLIDVLVDRSNIIWVLWETNGRMFTMSRYWGNLEPIDPGPIYIEVPGQITYTAAAAAEGVVALAYGILGDASDAWDLSALLLWETGTGIARKDVLLTTEQFADYQPTVAFDGNAFVYAWSHAKGDFPSYVEDPVPSIELVGARVTPEGELLDATPIRIADDVGGWMQIDSARGTNGVAIAWQAEGRTTHAALFNGQPIDFGGSHDSFAELAPHDGGFLLLRGTSRKTPELTEAEYLVLGADLSIRETGELPPYEADGFWKPFDIDVIGGADPYSRTRSLRTKDGTGTCRACSSAVRASRFHAAAAFDRRRR